jgi:hypothetical protein
MTAECDAEHPREKYKHMPAPVRIELHAADEGRKLLAVYHHINHANATEESLAVLIRSALLPSMA